ncbi:MAG: histidine phosphatase family protein [Mycobacterium sp.]|nr:histidine phosphatase family protein [Mycobacterium sp.]
MQLILVRHGQATSAEPENPGCEPQLTELGIAQVERLPQVLRRYQRCTSLVCSPQQRAEHTAQIVGAALGLTPQTIPGLAECDYGRAGYVPLEQIPHDSAIYQRLRAGQFPLEVDEDEFRHRIMDAIVEIASETDCPNTVVAITDGGVVNIILQDILRLPRPLNFPIDYASITQINYARSSRTVVAIVNEIGHVWDLLPGAGLSAVIAAEPSSE